MINIKKSPDAPVCLATEKAKKSSENYRCGDVLYRIRDDFNNKCYLCEEKMPSTINVEHFLPHKGDRNLMFDWTNLFYACGHCNNTKLHGFTNILNCTKAQPVICDVLQFEINPSFPKENVIVIARNKEPETIETAELLNLIYNGKNTPIKIIEGENIRQKVCDDLNNFIANLNDYFNDELLITPLRNALKRDIIKELQPQSSFTAFKIWTIKQNSNFYKEFVEYLP